MPWTHGSACGQLVNSYRVLHVRRHFRIQQLLDDVVRPLHGGKMQRSHSDVVSYVHLAPGHYQCVHHLVVFIPASQMQRGPPIFSLLVDVAFHGDEYPYYPRMAVESGAVERVRSGLV